MTLLEHVKSINVSDCYSKQRVFTDVVRELDNIITITNVAISGVTVTDRVCNALQKNTVLCLVIMS